MDLQSAWVVMGYVTLVGVGEVVGGMVNGAGLTPGSIARSGASGGGSTMGTETYDDNELAKVRGFLEGDRRGFGKKVLG